ISQLATVRYDLSHERKANKIATYRSILGQRTVILVYGNKPFFQRLNNGGVVVFADLNRLKFKLVLSGFDTILASFGDQLIDGTLSRIRGRPVIYVPASIMDGP
ncbi:MAG: hypothetical protein IPK01_13310, partial [Acidobacteria bacterium]|nr:hypothetical protein [Acidobacteriota bacterium]